MVRRGYFRSAILRVELAALLVAMAATLACSGASTEPPRTVLLLTGEGPAFKETRIDYAKAGERFSEVSGRTLRVDIRSLAADDQLRAKQIASLALNSPAVIVAAPMSMAREIQQRHPALPIVFDGSGDPIDLCLVDSLLKPGRSATGRTLYFGDFERQARALAYLFPAHKQWFVVADGSHDVRAGGCDPRNEPAQQPALDEGCDSGVLDRRRVANDDDLASMQAVALRYAPRVSIVGTCSVEGLLAWIRSIAGRHDVAVLMATTQYLNQGAHQIVEALNDAGVPAIYDRRRFVALGAPLAAAPRDELQRVQAIGELVEMILRGVPPGELPVRVPASIDVVLNVSAIVRAGWKPDPRGLLQVDEFVR